ncbi:hypothetical protein N825_27110 [Skermanella stibiiresistens SB22]|uniref:Uncharacterized protein n=1 Tax=Skermanella stibiiresistens SB22 TaxID=1385369 RepID=W9GY58_9PROT|nr:hypothetical protein [Skermanella stibiiresistens]EWY36418.1 hypothetical protein N825_27110 [Skermanella stibiiresistens SB22]
MTGSGITPASTRPEPDIEMRRAVALAYRTIRQQGGGDLPAWKAARAEVMRRKPEMTEWDAGKRAVQIISWAASEHTAWFWKNVGEGT